MPDPAKPEETLGLIQGLAKVVQKQQAVQKAQNEAHLQAMEKTHEHSCIKVLTFSLRHYRTRLPLLVPVKPKEFVSRTLPCRSMLANKI